MRTRRAGGATRQLALVVIGTLVVTAFASTPPAMAGSPTSAPQPAPTTPAAATAGTVDPPTDQLIVRFEGDAPRDLDALLAAAGAGPDDRPGRGLELVRQMDDGSWVVKLPGRRSLAAVEAIAARWERRGGVVAAAEPDAVALPTLEPDDPSYALQWHYAAPTASTYGIDLPAAWDITTGSADVVVAVIDSGILDHADLAGRVLPGYDMIADLTTANDGNARDADASDPGDWVTAAESASGPLMDCPVGNSTWHGTHVAGTIGASTDNGLGVAGVSWSSPILPVRVLGKCGGFISDIADGMRWAAGLSVAGVPNNPNPADVLNLSLGGTGTCSTTYQNAIDAVAATGAVVVVSAGNSDVDASGARPANCAGVITVAAADQLGDKASYSNFGTTVEITAPGGQAGVDTGVRSTSDSGTTVPAADVYRSYQGTSMAAPHVSGVVSLLLAVDPDLAAAEILTILQGTALAFPDGSTCTTALCGPGLLDAGAAVAAAAGPCGYPVVLSDVGAGHPFRTEIEWLIGEGVISGFPDCTFRSTTATSRQAMAAFLYRFEEVDPAFVPPVTPTFNDYPPTAAFYREVEWLAAQGIAGGFLDGGFHPNDAVSRQAMAAFLYRYAGEPPFSPPGTASFADYPVGSAFFEEVEWLVTTGITTGFATDPPTFQPNSPVTRQATAAFLHRYDTVAALPR